VSFTVEEVVGRRIKKVRANLNQPLTNVIKDEVNLGG